ncbi:hypothetical protein ACSBM8_01660 [Sphingomonas sp. ASY06-1R]|uniref:hypothetical protein n=1 Tax=Sphingomonas sp. ASY06-1R TaxID=3445771 RepID=UPI003FA2C754
MIDFMFGTTTGFGHARVFSHNFCWPFHFDREMAPNGNIYIPNPHYKEDYSDPTVPLKLRAVFMHESTHLYQWYILGKYVWYRRARDRTYDYKLVRGKGLSDYGIEQAGQIVEDYYILSNGGSVPGLPYDMTQYGDAVPIPAPLPSPAPL